MVERNNLNDIKLQDSHPNLYRGIMVFAFIGIALGFNFFFTNPTFQQYGIDKNIIGAIFMALGVGKIVFLNFFRSVKIVRGFMAASVGFKMFWAVGTSLTFFTGQTSLQLFILYIGLSILELFLLVEPFTNPANANGKNGHTI